MTAHILYTHAKDMYVLKDKSVWHMIKKYISSCKSERKINHPSQNWASGRLVYKTIVTKYVSKIKVKIR